MRMEPVLRWNTTVTSNLHSEGKLTINGMILVTVRETKTCTRHKTVFVRCRFPEDKILVRISDPVQTTQLHKLHVLRNNSSGTHKERRCRERPHGQQLLCYLPR